MSDIFADGYMTAICGRRKGAIAKILVNEMGERHPSTERCALCNGKSLVSLSTRAAAKQQGLPIRVICFPCWDRAGRPAPPAGFTTSAAQRHEVAQITGDAQAVEKVAAKLGASFHDIDKEN